MSATNAAENALLSLIFTNTDFALVGDAGGLRGSVTAGVFYVSLHATSPGETGSQNTNETPYTSYARQSIVRSTAGWTVASGVVDNDGVVTYPVCGVTGGNANEVGIGSDVSGAGNLWFYGALASPQVIATGQTPSFAAGAIDITLD